MSTGVQNAGDDLYPPDLQRERCRFHAHLAVMATSGRRNAEETVPNDQIYKFTNRGRPIRFDEVVAAAGTNSISPNAVGNGIGIFEELELIGKPGTIFREGSATLADIIRETQVASITYLSAR